MFPCHSPLTSTVTSVDWIQSGRAQPSDADTISPATAQPISRPTAMRMAGSYDGREGAQNDYHDGRGRLVSYEELVREPLSRAKQRQPGGLRRLALLGMLGLLGLSRATPAAAQDVRCNDYSGLDRTQRAYLAY